MDGAVGSGRLVKETEEEVFDSNLSVSKSPDWGLATPDQMRREFNLNQGFKRIIHSL